MKLYFERAVQS